MKLRRNITTDKEVWLKAQIKASKTPFSLSAIITMLLTKWIKDKKA